MAERIMKMREGSLKDYSSTNQGIIGKTAVARELGTVPPLVIALHSES